MILNTTQSISAVPFHKNENIVFKPSASVLRNANGRRPRSRTNNMPSPVVISREAARDPVRRRPAPVAPGRTLRAAVKDPLAQIANIVNASPTPTRIAIPKRLRRPAFCEIAPAAIEAVDPDLKGVKLEYIHQKLQHIGQRYVFFPTNALALTDHPVQDVIRRC